MFVELKNVYYRYQTGENYILKGVNLQIEKGEFVALVGPTGSGKSTMVQTINGLLRPSRGEVLIEGREIGEWKSPIQVRKKVGLVFQYPEHQLFEETVFKDIAFGPKNLGWSAPEIEEKVKKAMEFVQLDYEELKDRSPFGLSGGQKRRAAIAGVLAMEPELLILDEPIAGLDPRGRRKLLDRINWLNQEQGISVLFISHRMEDAARRADRLLVMNQGQIMLQGSPREIFAQRDLLYEVGLEIPPLNEVLWKLRQKGYGVRTDIFSMEDVEEEILRHWRGCRCSKI